MSDVCYVVDGGRLRRAGDPADCSSTGNERCEPPYLPNNRYFACVGPEGLEGTVCNQVRVPSVPTPPGPGGGSAAPGAIDKAFAWVKENPLPALLVALLLLGGRRR